MHAGQPVAAAFKIAPALLSEYHQSISRSAHRRPSKHCLSAHLWQRDHEAMCAVWKLWRGSTVTSGYEPTPGAHQNRALCACRDIA